ncbi:hypothetical protein [Streptomyces sp. NPDC002328]|uniref:hypothetical protein n=1 Tax=Streptomyces sp. NPDC002328 TaxID=3364642 RepID=UPI003691CC11
MKHYIAERTATALLCAAMTVVIAGCGADSAEVDAKSTSTSTGTAHPFDAMTSEQIDNQVRETLRNTTSMRLTGKASSEGRQAKFDLAMDVHGSCNGTVDNSLGSIRIIKKGSLVHVKAEEEYWRATFSRGMTAELTEEMVAAFKGRWIKPPKMMSETIGRICEPLEGMIEAISPVSDGTATREADATVGGRPVVVLTERSPTRTVTLYIAKEGKPHVLRSTVARGDEPMDDLIVTDHDKPVDTTPPPPDEILDPTTLR